MGQNPPIEIFKAIAASTESTRSPPVTIVKGRTLSTSVRIKFGGSIDADATVKAYYSPDGEHWDTLAADEFDVTFSAGNWVQLSKIWDIPEFGYLQFSVTNGSAADVITFAEIRVTYASWPEATPSIGDISTQKQTD